MKYIFVIIVLLFSAQAIGSPDLNSDGVVNFLDYYTFANYWQTSNAGCDFNADGIVNYKDLRIFAEYWLSDTHIYKTLTTSTSGGGTVTTPGIGTYTYIYNTSATITASANINYGFVNWTGSAVTAGKVSAPNSANTTCLMDTNYTVQANFVMTTDPNTSPVVIDCNYIGYTFITKEITLTATAGTQPILDYYIISGANDVNAYLEDPASGVGKIIKFPHRIRNHGTKVWLAANAVKNYSFKWRATDGLHNSHDANCAVNVLANPKDCLSFDGQGWITIPDNSSLDLEPNRAIGFCLKTRTPFMGILKKHETGKAGYEINLVSGKIVADVYSASGLVAEIKSNLRYDNGKWCNVVFVLNDANDSLGLYTGFDDLFSGTTWYSNGELLWNGDGAILIIQGLYSNDCNIVVGKSNYGFYKGEIDAIRSYNLVMSDNFRSLACVQSRETAGDTETYVPVPIVRFKCNEHTGTTITDDKHSPNLVGTFSDSNIYCIVTGNGYPNPNGNYNIYGTLNGHPTYKKINEEWYIYYLAGDVNYWVINNVFGVSPEDGFIGGITIAGSYPSWGNWSGAAFVTTIPSGHIQWTPWNWFWMDINVLRNR